MVAVVAIVAAGDARGDARTERAREHYLQGDAYYKLDKYADALREYEQAYIAKPDPSFLYNIAQCHRLMGNRADAIKFYKRYLQDASGAANRGIAEKHIRDLESNLPRGAAPAETPPRPAAAATKEVSPPAPTAVLAAPMPGPAETAAPKPVTKLALDAPPPGQPPPAAAVENDSRDSPEGARPFYTRWWFWTAIGVVVVGTVLIAAAASRDPSCPAGRFCQ